MDYIVISLIVFGIIAMIALIAGMVFLFHVVGRKADESGKKLSFLCNKCNESFEMPLAYFLQHPFTPRRSISVKVAGTGGTVKVERRVLCPNCGKKTWCKQIIYK